MRVHFDFETRSTLPFGRGADAVTGYQYANHETTDIWCMSWAIGDDPVKLWDPWEGQDFPDELLYALRDGLTFVAHQAAFEWCIWNFLLVPRYGLPKLPFSQMDCTAARAAVMALPRSLEQACKVMNLPVQKDMAGSRLMQQMARPRRPRKGEDASKILWWDDPARRQRLGAYCIQDTEAERALDKVLFPLSPAERELWLLDHRTNMRGVQVDVEFARKASKVMAVMEKRYCDEIARLTDYQVNAATEVGQMKTWLETQGVFTESLDKSHIIHLLEDPDIPSRAKEVLRLRQEAGKSSVAKLSRFITLTAEDGRMRENFLFHGANTGRLAGKGAQLQNLPSRGGLKWNEADQVMDIVLEHDDPEAAADLIELLHGEVPTAISSCLRGCIQAPAGKNLYVADFSNIEGRVAAWLGNEQWKMQAFREYDQGTGPDLYTVTAGQILGISPDKVSKVERNSLGKVSELALGFGGGFGAFDSMAAIYNIDMGEHWPTIQRALDQKFISQAHKNWERFGHQSGAAREVWLASEAVKIAWRDRHPGIVKCWYDAEACAIKALKNPGNWFSFADGKCAFGATNIGGVTFLISRLPNGRRIYRAHARIKTATKFGKVSEQIEFQGVDSVTRQWVRMTTYGGDLFQSFVQAIARDLMYAGWVNVEARGFEVVLSVHDEIGAEAEESRTLEEFIEGMTDLPAWADGCPVSAAGYVAKRYRKD